MGKRKQQTSSTSPNNLSIDGKDSWKRLNFLYQAAHLYSTPLLTSNPSSFTPISHEKQTSLSGIKKSKRKTLPLASLSRHLCTEFLLSAQKNTLRIDPEVKHTICTRCHSFLTFPFTCTLDMKYPAKTKRQKAHPGSYTPLPVAQRITCHFCKYTHTRLSSNHKIPFHLRAQIPKKENCPSLVTEEEKKREVK